MNASETRVPSYSNVTLELVEDDGVEHPLGVSALVSRLNCSSSASDAGSQESPEPPEGCSGEEHRQEKNFPWLNGFSRQCRSSIGSKSMKQLDDLLATYLGHVTPHYRDCHKLPNKAAKLKRNINDTMIFFHMLYMDIREPLENAFYYDKMTELMAMYLDLEITASRRGKDTEKTVTNKLSTSLYTFLDHSEDHILDALLKTKLINKHSRKVCVPLLRKILSELVVRRPLAELTYVRFLLSFKRWKNIVADVEERRAINKLAAQRLHPPPEYFQDHEVAKPNAEVLPRVPKTKKNWTVFYLGAKFSLKDSCRAFFRHCKETSRSNGYRRNLAASEDLVNPFLISRRSEKINDVEENSSFSLINDIWSTISNGDSCTNLLGESDMFSDIQVDENSDTSSEHAKKKKAQPDSPDSRIDSPDKIRRKDVRKKKENSVPDPKFVILKTEGVTDPISTLTPAKGVQDCCLGSVFMMEQVNKVGGGQSHVKTDPCEAELPTSSRQHSVLESLVYVQPGTDNEAVASSSVSPDGGSVATSHLDTNECDSSVEILQSRQGPADVSLPLELGLKPPLNIDEELRPGKVTKEDLLLFSGSDGDPFSEFNMFRLNDDLFNCRSTFGGIDQAIYRRTDVPFQGSPLLEEDEDDYSRFRWTGVSDFHPSVQSTIINQSTGTGPSADLSSCYAGVDSKSASEDREEPKLGHDMKQGKGSSQGMLWHRVVWEGKGYLIPSNMLERFKAVCMSQIQSKPVREIPHLAPSNPISSPMSLSHCNSNDSVMVEGSDNLKILAEEAVRVREASVAEAKCKSDLVANLNLPLKKRKSLPSVGSATCNGKVIKSEASYPSIPMLSIAQVAGVSKSVIVMNSQYTWPNGPAAVPPVTQVTDIVASTACGAEVGTPTNYPLDMRASKQPENLHVPETAAEDQFHKTFLLPCKFCRQAGCYGGCHSVMKTGNHLKCPETEKYAGVGRGQKTIHSSIPKCVCQRANCVGKCIMVNGPSAMSDKSEKDKSHERSHKSVNGILKTRHSSSALDSICYKCQGNNCGGKCKLISGTSHEATRVPKVTFQESKAVLKCIQCKFSGCNGKCMTSHSRCSTANSSNRKVHRCVLCKNPSCTGSCKNSGYKCSMCSSGSCEGTCCLSGRSTNNSLSTVNDFSILNSSAFIERHTKCNICRNACCGKCKNAAGFKYCPFCSADVYNGNNTNHSIRSILGSSSKTKADMTDILKRPKASSSNRRTRSSSTVSKQYAPCKNNDTQSFTVDDVKRRKKSLPKPVSR